MRQKKRQAILLASPIFVDHSNRKFAIVMGSTISRASMKQQRVDAPPPVASEEARMRCQSKSNMQAALASAFWGNMELKCTNDQRR